jgi:ribulose-5-phosphate 4-epimerase/fuculose-1-phosphate aldolase
MKNRLGHHEERIDLAAAFRTCNRLNLNEGIANHFSLMLDGPEPTFLVNPRGLHFEEITASRLIEVDLSGRVVEGEGEVREVAFFIHGRVHQALPHARCILHVHPPYATALSLVQHDPSEFGHQTAILFHNQIAVDEDFGGYALDAAEGDRIARALGDRSVLMMGNHGVTVAAPTVAIAFNQLYFLERLCMYQVLAMSTGRAVRQMPEDVLHRFAHPIDSPLLQVEEHFAAMKRILDRKEPDYRE